MTMYRFFESLNVPHRLTKNGCRTRSSISRSELVCSTCFILMTRSLDSTLIAYDRELC